MHDLYDSRVFTLIMVWCLGIAIPAMVQAEDLSRVQRITKSLELLQVSARTYTKERDCFSCHHQALPVMTFQLARQRKVVVPVSAIQEQCRFTDDYYQKRLESIRKGTGIPGGAYSAGYALLAMAAGSSAPGENQQAMVDYLYRKQSPQGGWRIGTHRPPLEDSHFTATAVSVAGIQWADRRPDTERLKQAVRDARRWLRATPPETTEDRIFQLLGLCWSQDDFRGSLGPLVRRVYQEWELLDASIAKNGIDQLLRRQQEDGGWGQLPGGASDAYATGQVLCCLYVVGGLDITSEAFLRGIRYLEAQQAEDGSWKVKTRSQPIQVYFESGFPHGKSQFISIAASCWATMALLLTQQIP